VLALLAGGGFLALRLLRAPSLDGVEPTRARVGQTVALIGKGFTAEPEGSVVLFGDKPGTILKASPNRLEATVPDGVAALGEDVQVPVRVRVRGRDSRPVEITVFQGPTIHGISPDVAMPGDEVVLLGTGWGVGASVKFGSVPAEVLLATDTSIRVRVPPVEGGPGTSAPVVVSMGISSSNPGPFLIGRVPLLLKVEPSPASPGDAVTISGRGFRRERGQNSVSIGGARALLASAFDSELKVVAPWVPAGGGEWPVEVRVAGSDNLGRATLAMPPPPEVVDFRFVAEPFEGPPGRDHAILATALGPAFVLSAAGGRSAAERAVEAQRRLNDAAVLLKASRTVDLEVRDLETRPILALAGRPETLLEVTEEDAAGYNEDWTGLRGRGGTVTRYRLARWWEAVAKDLVLLLVRGEKPTFAAALAPEGKVLAEVFQAAQKTGRFGVAYSVVTEEKPATREALRLLALRVPVGVKGLAGEEKAPAAAASGPPPLALQGTWTGSEIEGPSRRWLTIRFTPSGGNVSYEGTVTLTVPILSLEQLPKAGLRFSVQFRGGIRYYLGTWDGETLTGKISTDPAGASPLATFEIRPR